ncbi:MAG TPA: hypothetical protein VGM43_26945 [Bryobacteraceae bacterium]
MPEHLGQRVRNKIQRPLLIGPADQPVSWRDPFQSLSLLRRTFGNRAVVEVPGLHKFMRYICRNGFEHHAAMNASSCGSALADALETYLRWPVHTHNVERE